MLDTLKRFFNFIMGPNKKKQLTVEERMAKIKKESELASLGRIESGHRKYKERTSYRKVSNRSIKNRIKSDDDINSMLYASILYNNYSDENYNYDDNNSEHDYDNDYKHDNNNDYDNDYEQDDYQYEDCNSDHDSGGYDSGDSSYDFDSGGCDFDFSND